MSVNSSATWASLSVPAHQPRDDRPYYHVCPQLRDDNRLIAYPLLGRVTGPPCRECLLKVQASLPGKRWFLRPHSAVTGEGSVDAARVLASLDKQSGRGPHIHLSFPLCER
jgi:hypothetical protein